MLQSVVEEVPDQLSLENDENMKSNKSKNTNKHKHKNKNKNNAKDDNSILPHESTALVGGKHSDGSIEYDNYKRRQEEFNKIINDNWKQIKHNTNAMNMNLISMYKSSTTTKAKTETETKTKTFERWKNSSEDTKKAFKN